MLNVISPTKTTLVSSLKTNHVTRAARPDYHMGIRLQVLRTTRTRPVLVLRTQVRDAATYASARASGPFMIFGDSCSDPLMRSLELQLTANTEQYYVQLRVDYLELSTAQPAS